MGNSCLARLPTPILLAFRLLLVMQAAHIQLVLTYLLVEIVSRAAAGHIEQSPSQCYTETDESYECGGSFNPTSPVPDYSACSFTTQWTDESPAPSYVRLTDHVFSQSECYASAFPAMRLTVKEGG